MRYLSVCSGIEAASVAWHPLGWEPVAFAEVEPFPSAVLAHHYPNVPNLGDMTKFKEWPDATFDVLVGGTPCQSFSVAGKRGGMDDPRGRLAYSFAGIAARYRPEWIVWENVPGVLSSAGGRDFAGFVRGLAELGYQCAWRVLDAQFFGVPQRRRRVFLIGNSGGWQRAAAALFERESMLGNPPPQRKTRQVASTIPARSTGGGGLGTDFDCDGGVISTVAHSLRGEGFDASEDGTGRGTPIVPVHAFDARQSDVVQYGDMTGPLDTDGHSVAVAIPIISDADRADSSAQTPSPDAEGRIRLRDPGLGIGDDGDPMYTLQATKPHAVAFNTYNQTLNPHTSQTIKSPQGAVQESVGTVLQSMQVRRLTPVECSRLQGFPDDYLELTYADADEAHSAQVLHELWHEAGAPTVDKQGWRAGISAARLAPERLLAGVSGGWLSRELAQRCAAARGALPGEDYCHEGFVLALREAGKARRSPYKRESFGQLARKLGSGLSILPLESAQARKVLRSSRLWPEAQAKWPLRYALAKGKAREAIGRMNPDGPRYKALGNSMAVPVMRWIGQRIDTLLAVTP